MLTLKNINVVFNKGNINEKKVLKDICLDIKKGDFITIIGSNGAGKSTLFQAISGSVDIESGQIFLNHKDLTHQEEYKRSCFIGRLFQDPLKGTAPSLTIEENLSLASQRGKHSYFSFYHHKKKELFQNELAKLGLGLEKRLNDKVGTLSGGQRQALTLLMATLVTPQLLLLDEHTAALDPISAKNILDLTDKMIKEKQITTLMITHNMEDALNYGNKTMIMKDGEIVMILEGEERKKMSVEELIHLYSTKTNQYQDNLL